MQKTRRYSSEVQECAFWGFFLTFCKQIDYLTCDHIDEGQSHYGETLKESQPLPGFPISYAIYSILQSAPKQLLICNLVSRHLNIKYNKGETADKHQCTCQQNNYHSLSRCYRSRTTRASKYRKGNTKEKRVIKAAQKIWGDHKIVGPYFLPYCKK